MSATTTTTAVKIWVSRSAGQAASQPQKAARLGGEVCRADRSVSGSEGCSTDRQFRGRGGQRSVPEFGDIEVAWRRGGDA